MYCPPSNRPSPHHPRKRVCHHFTSLWQNPSSWSGAPRGFFDSCGLCPRQPTAPDVELLGWGWGCVVMPSGVAQLSPLRTGWVCPGLTLGGHTDSSGSLCPRVGHLSSSSGLYLPHTHTQRSFYGEGMDRGRRGKQRCEPPPLLRCMLKGRGG